MIDAEQLRAEIMQLIPTFIGDEEGVMKGRPPSECALFTRLLDEVYPWVEARDEDRLRPIFLLVERCTSNGTPSVDNAVCACFLESLSNRLGWNQPDLKPWVREQLGPSSRGSWDAWEET